MRELPLETRTNLYRHLLHLAEADGKTSEEEQKSLQWFAWKWSIEEPEKLTAARGNELPEDPAAGIQARVTEAAAAFRK